MADITLRVNGVNNANLHQFTSLQAAILHASTYHTDLTLLQGCINIEISSTITDATAASVTGFTNPTPSYYIHIYTTTSTRHKGVWGTAYKYRLQQAVATRYPLQIATSYTRVTGLQIGNTYAATTGYSPVIVNGASNVLLDSCVIRGDSTNTALEGAIVRTGTSPASVTLRNCIVQGSSAGLAALYTAAGGTLTAQGCTIYTPNTQYGLVSAGVMMLTNCYIGGPTVIKGSGDITLTKCATSDTSALDPTLRSIAPAVGSGAYFTSITAGSENFKVTSASSPLVNVGQDLSATYTTDILQAPRINGHDIGAFTKFITTAAHPRLWLTAEHLTTLQARLASNPTYYTTFKSFWDAYLGTTITSGFMYLNWYGALMAYALLYQITPAGATKDAYGAKGVVYLNALLNDMQTDSRYPGSGVVGNGLGDGNLPSDYPYTTVIAPDSAFSSRSMAAVSIGRDWLAPLLDTATIDLCATRMKKWITYVFDVSQYREDFDSNYGAGHFALLSTAVIGLYGDSGYEPEWESRLGYAWMRVKAAMRELEGDTQDGWSYGAFAIANWLGYAEAFKNATGSSAEWDAVTYHTEFVEMLAYALHPSRLRIADHGRWPNGNKADPQPIKCAVALIADRAPISATEKANLRWYVANAGTIANPDTTGFLGWYGIVYHDAAATTTMPSLTTLGSLTRHPTLFFRRHVTRSGEWSDTSATMVEMLAPAASLGYESAALGEFGSIKVASRGSKLLTDALAFNAQGVSSHFSVPRIAGSHVGQPGTDQRPDSSETFEGVWEDGKYTYLKANNYHVFYDAGSVSATFGSRSLVYIVPDLLLVYDNFTVPSATTNLFTERWVFAGTPVATGSVVTFVNGSAQIVQTYLSPPVGIIVGDDFPDGQNAGPVAYADATATTLTTSNQFLMAFETMASTGSSVYDVTELSITTGTTVVMRGVYVQKGTTEAWVVAWTASTTGASVADTSIRFDLSTVVVGSPTLTFLVADLPTTNLYDLETVSSNIYRLVVSTTGAISVDSSGLLAYGDVAPSGPHVSRPYQDASAGTWTASTVGASLFDMLNEDTASDADTISSNTSPVEDAVLLEMTELEAPATDEPVTITVRAKSRTTATTVAVSFEDVTASTNLTTLFNAWKAESDALGHYWWPSEVTGGDFTGSGRCDLVVTNHSTAGGRIFTHVGNDSSGIPQFADYTTARTLSGTFYDMGTEGAAYIVDYNGDGYPDILAIGSSNQHRAINDGSGNFTVSASTALSMVQMHAGDTTGDGRIDLIGLLTRQAGVFRSYVNSGSGTYTSSTTATVGEFVPLTTAMTLPAMSGLTYPTCRKVNLGTAIGEVILITFGEGYDFAVQQRVFAIKDVGGGVYSDVTAALGLPSDGNVAGIYDFNRDGLLDVLITDSVVGGIYRNNGVGQLIRQVDGLAADIAAQTAQEGCVTLDVVADFDEDGKAEILLQHGRYGYYSRLYQEIGDAYSRAYNFNSPYAYQFLVADMNGDGRLDVVAMTAAGPRLYLNRTTAAGNWLNVKLSGPTVNKVGIDAVIEAYTAGSLGHSGYKLATVKNNTVGGPVRTAVTSTGHSHGGNLPVHLGLGLASSVDVRVTYPGGTVVDRLAVATNQTVTI